MAAGACRAAAPGRGYLPLPGDAGGVGENCGLAWSGGIYVANCSAYPMVADVRVWLEE